MTNSRAGFDHCHIRESQEISHHFFFLSDFNTLYPIQYTGNFVKFIGALVCYGWTIRYSQLFLSPFVFCWSESNAYPYVCNLPFPTSFIGLYGEIS